MPKVEQPHFHEAETDGRANEDGIRPFFGKNSEFVRVTRSITTHAHTCSRAAGNCFGRNANRYVRRTQTKHNFNWPNSRWFSVCSGHPSNEPTFGTNTNTRTSTLHCTLWPGSGRDVPELGGKRAPKKYRNSRNPVKRLTDTTVHNKNSKIRFFLFCPSLSCCSEYKVRVRWIFMRLHIICVEALLLAHTRTLQLLLCG